ncbi:MAG: metallophosphoesterase [Bacteroidota bacterium]
MNIIFITDLHIGAAGEDTYGVDVRQNFLNILEEIKKQTADHLIIGGDLCYRDGEATIYAWIKSHLDQLAIPYDLIAGNHDDSKLIADAFGLHEEFQDQALYYHRAFPHWDAFFLDTSTGVLTDPQLHWLQARLASCEQSPIIFMHHPPLAAQVNFMDNHHALKNMEAVQTILKKDHRIIPVFTGHYHTEKTVVEQNIVQQITPSCFTQIDQFAPNFKVAHHQIAYRIIQLSKGNWKSSVFYRSGAQLSRG